MTTEPEAPIEISDDPEELSLSPVQTAALPAKKRPGRPKMSDEQWGALHPGEPRRDRTKSKTQDEIRKENLDALPEAERNELQALADECWMVNKMMRDVAWLHIGYGEAGVDRVYPDLAFEAVKAHVKNSGGLIEKYPVKNSEMPEVYKRYGLLTQLYAQDFRPFCYQVADWCHKHLEENFDREVETECTLISGWRPQPQSSPKKIAAFEQSADEKMKAEAEKSRLRREEEQRLDLMKANLTPKTNFFLEI